MQIFTHAIIIIIGFILVLAGIFNWTFILKLSPKYDAFDNLVWLVIYRILTTLTGVLLIICAIAPLWESA